MKRVRGLDGLRAFAVIGVLLYHADLQSVPGGFLGVDVFFVLSGYLITSLILREWDGSGRLGFGHFYAARARRLLPGLAGLLVGTAAAALILAPDAVSSLRRTFLPSIFYVSNWSSIYTHSSYFEQTGRPPLLLHLWSLGVEEQFYLLWPIAAVLVLRRFQGQDGRRVLRKLAIRGAILSAAWMAYVSIRHGFPVPHDPSRAYYGSDTHASGLLIGCALACVWQLGTLPKLVRYERAIFDATGLAALAGLGWAYHVTSEFSPWLYRGGFFLYSFTAAVVIAVLAHPECLLGRVLSVQPLRWIGERSYGIYLWHWPVFQLTRPSLDIGWTGTPNLLLRLAITGVLAELSWRYVEMPVRRGALGRLWRVMRLHGPRRAVLTQRAVVTTALTFSLASLLVVSALAVDRPKAAASDSVLDTAPPNVEPTPALSPTPTARASPRRGGNQATPSGQPVATSTRPASKATQPAAPPPPAPKTTAYSVTTWGDSVVLGAAWALRARMPGTVVDAVVGRQAWDLPQDMAQLRHSGLMGRTVVLHVGDNGLFLQSTLSDTLNSLSDRHRVVLVTIRVPRRWQDPVNDLLRSEAPKHRNVVIADWNAASAGHPEYFVKDGVHLTQVGCQAFAETIARAVG